MMTASFRFTVLVEEMEFHSAEEIVGSVIVWQTPHSIQVVGSTLEMKLHQGRLFMQVRFQVMLWDNGTLDPLDKHVISFK